VYICVYPRFHSGFLGALGALGALGGSIFVLGSLGVLAVRLSFKFLGGLSLFDRRLSAFICGSIEFE
jgi:hypothetical protein